MTSHITGVLSRLQSHSPWPLDTVANHQTVVMLVYVVAAVAGAAGCVRSWPDRCLLAARSDRSISLSFIKSRIDPPPLFWILCGRHQRPQNDQAAMRRANFKGGISWICNTSSPCIGQNCCQVFLPPPFSHLLFADMRVESVHAATD